MSETRAKYHNQPTERDGYRFASKAEAEHYSVLALRQALGQITDLRLQPRYPLTVNGVRLGTYVGDFAYHEGGRLVVVDVKGVRTPVYRLKRKLVRALYGIEITEVPA